MADLNKTLPTQGTEAPTPVPKLDATTVAQAPATTSEPSISPTLPPTIGRYILKEEIAAGGMGIVYRAADPTFGRNVAVKLVKEQYADHSWAKRRFLEEAQITGQLQHPGIPPVHELGTLPDGRPYLVMKLIRGETLDGLLTKERKAASIGFSANLGKFIAIFEQICQAIAYAHKHGVIHRDLKPANIMVGAFGETQVMDWGLAKLLNAPSAFVPSNAAPATTFHDPRLESDSGHTQPGAVLGTPAYMPPEQAIGLIDQIDRQSDVFGLGAILCQILTGLPPYTGGTAEALRLKAARADLVETHSRLAKSGAEPELIALTKRCLAAVKEDRPQDGEEVAAAISSIRSQAEERAREAEIERVNAEAKRQKAELRATEQRKRRQVWIGLAAALLIGVVVSIGLALWALGAEKLADKNAKEASQKAADAFAAEKKATGETARAEANARDARTQLSLARRHLYAAQLKACSSTWRSDPGAALAHLMDPVSCPEDLMEFTWRLNLGLCRRDERQWQGHRGEVRFVVFSGDGRTLVSGGADGALGFWEVPTGRLLRSVSAHSGPVLAGAVAPNDDVIATAGQDGLVKLWAMDGTCKNTLKGHTAAAKAVAFGSDGRLYTVGDDRTVRCWDVTSGESKWSNTGLTGVCHSLVLSPDGTQLYGFGGRRKSAAPTFEIVTSSIASNKPIDSRPRRPSQSDAVDPDATEIIWWNAGDGKMIGHQWKKFGIFAGSAASGVFDRVRNRVLVSVGSGVTFLDPATADSVTFLDGLHAAPIRSIAIAADGGMLATASSAGHVDLHRQRGHQPVFLWRLPSLELESYLVGVKGTATATAFAPADNLLAVGTRDGVLSLWRTGPQVEQRILKHPYPVQGVQYAQNGRLMVVRPYPEGDSLTLPISVWNHETGRRTLNINPGPKLRAVCILADGRGAGTISNDTVRLWDLETGERRREIRIATDESVVSDDSQWLAALHGDSVEICGLGTTPYRRRVETPFPVKAVRFAGGTTPILAVVGDTSVRFWDASTEQFVDQRPLLRGEGVWALAPGGQLFACVAPFVSATQGGRESGPTIRIHDVASGTLRYELRCLQVPASLAFLPDGKTLVGITGGAYLKRPSEVTLWDVASGTVRVRRPASSFDPHWSVSPDGSLLALGGWNAVGGSVDIDVWEVTTGRSLATLRGHTKPIFKVVFSPDGQTLASCGMDRSVHLWDPHSGDELAAFTGYEGTVFDVSFAPDGNTLAAACYDGTVRVWRVLDAKAALTRAVREHVDALFRELPLRSEVVERLNADGRLGPSFRAQALKEASILKEDPYRITQTSLLLSVQSGESADYQRALFLARAAVRLVPGDREAVRALGFAQCRCNQHEAALATLLESDKGQAGRERRATLLGFQAMALHGLGKLAEAKAALAKMKEVLPPSQSGNYDDRLTRDLFEEASKLIDGDHQRKP